MRPFITALGALAVLSACGGGESTPPVNVSTSGTSMTADLSPDYSVHKHIKHVVIIVQENRSFDNIFAGFPGANSQMFGYMHDGTKVNLQPIPFEVRDMAHYYLTGLMDYDNGKMDQFDLNPAGAGTVGSFAYSYLEHNETQPYWAMARRYVLADAMFPTMFGPSFTGHLTLIAGTASLSPTLSEADVPNQMPWGCDAPAGTITTVAHADQSVTENGPFPCFTQFRTLADTLDAKGVSWKYYVPALNAHQGGNEWSMFDAIKSVRYNGDWEAKVISPPQTVLTDARNNNLPGVSWVIPDSDWSDHPYSGTPYGPSWVAAVVNAIGQSKAWSSTAIVIVWDDWGGFFDNAPPPQLDFRGLGIRVPCIIVSPYVRPHVEHTQYEFGSIVRFVEDAFKLPPLGTAADGYTDARATSLKGAFNFGMKPRRFRKIPATYPAQFFLNRAPSGKAPDSD